MKKPKAILTFDLEFWYNSKFLEKHLIIENEDNDNDYIKESIESLIDLLKRYNQKATFFVLGKVAKKYPEIIKKIYEADHEIASHGYSHTILEKLGPDKFEQEILKTNKIIEEIINQKIIGFRAPNFSINKKTKWALKTLKKHNFQYDSSIHPLSFKRTLNNSSVIELPPSLGGVYFRLLPLKLYVDLIKLFKKTKIPITYFHPNELFESAPQIEYGPWWKKKIKYFGTKNAFVKFEKLLKEFNFISIKQYINENPIN